MCIVCIGVGIHADFPLIILHNREESIDRPTIDPRIIGDLIGPADKRHGGTWISYNTKKCFFVVLTNMNPDPQKVENKISRGLLVNEFVSGNGEMDLKKNWKRYQGFNLSCVNVKDFFLSWKKKPDSDLKIPFYTNRSADNRKTKNPLPGIELDGSKPLVTAFSSRHTFLYKKNRVRIDEMMKSMNELIVGDKTGDLSREYLLKRLSKVMSLTFWEIPKEEDRGGKTPGEFSKTRTQIAFLLEKTGKIFFYHRNTDKMNKSEALNEITNWKLLQSELPS